MPRGSPRPAGRLLAGLAVLAATLAAVSGAQARPAPAQGAGPGGIVHVGPDYDSGRPRPFAPGTAEKARLEALATLGRPAVRAVGDRRLWLASDDVSAETYLKYFALRGIGEHVEVWVASDQDAVSKDLEFRAGDCRNDERVQVTDAQILYLIDEFDTNVYPKESATFSALPPRDGSRAPLPAELGLPADYFAGEDDHVVVLVDNVRDAAFYDLNNAEDLPYIAGFFFSVFDDLVDRNVMTIDGFDWLHRTGASPPDEPAPGDRCRNKSARPYLYEATFAHEYQHLLEHYEDPDEVPWVDEGLADYAQTLTGYVDLDRSVAEIGHDRHVQCFLGNLGIQTPANPLPRGGGPENSLTLWVDQGDEEVLCDYGAAYAFMELLAGRYGEAFMSALHRDDGNGLAAVRRLVRAVASRRAAREVVHDWVAAMALDAVLDRGSGLRGGAREGLRVPSLDAAVNWDTADAYSTPGAPPNGADYVRLRGYDGAYLAAGELRSLSFHGAESMPPDPVEWAVDPGPPGRPGDAAFHSGSGPDFDRAVVLEVPVPRRNPVLTFDTLYDVEPGFDYAFVQISADGGRTYRSLANDLTVPEADPGALPAVLDNLPGLNGVSGGGEEAAWVTTSFDLSAYRGRTVLLAFRYVTDSFVDGPGWWVDDVRVGGVGLGDGSSLARWRTPTQIRPTPVTGFTVQLVGYSSEEPLEAAIHRLEFGEGFRASLGGRALRRMLDSRYDVVAALVTYDEPTESIGRYAPYTLRANGVVQPGG